MDHSRLVAIIATSRTCVVARELQQFDVRKGGAVTEVEEVGLRVVVVGVRHERCASGGRGVSKAKDAKHSWGKAVQARRQGFLKVHDYTTTRLHGCRSWLLHYYLIQTVVVYPRKPYLRVASDGTAFILEQYIQLYCGSIATPVV